MKPSAAYNTMNKFERQCYDWGWQDSQERIINLLKKYNCILDGSHHSDNLCTFPHHLGLLIELIEGDNDDKELV